MVAAARAWIEEVHPSAPHLVRTLEWVERLDPGAGEALRVAAVVHDAERAFPDPASGWVSRDHWDLPAYVRWHQDRSAEIAAEWLSQQGAAPALVSEVRALVAAHEEGGWPEADLLQAADSLSFLETMPERIATWPADRAEGKLRHMADRIAPSLPEARALAGQRLDAALAAAAPSFHMTPDDFRRHGHALVEWVAEYMERVAELPVQPRVEPGDVRARLPGAAPEDPEPFERLVADLDEVVLPGLTHWQSPGWFAYFPANASPPSVLAELVSAALGAQGMLWSSAPAVTEIEAHVLDWLVDLLGLPDTWKTAVGPGGGVIQTSASDSTHVAHVVARQIAVERGARIDDVVAYSSSQAHSSIEKGALVAGFRHVRLIDVDEQLALRPDALAAAVEDDLAAGLAPAIVTSAIGTTGTGAVDPLDAVAAIARQHGLWHHVDAAWAGSAMICPELRVHERAVASADSFVFDPHKWLFTNFDCSVFWVADRAPLIHTLSILPPYLQDAASASGDVIDYRDWHVPLGRRFRALKLWWVLRSYGARGLRHHIREHVRLARELGDRVAAHPGLVLTAPVSFGLVCLAHADGDEATAALAEAINREDSLRVTPSSVDGRRYIRVSVGATATTARDVDRLWSVIARAA